MRIKVSVLCANFYMYILMLVFIAPSKFDQNGFVDSFNFPIGYLLPTNQCMFVLNEYLLPGLENYFISQEAEFKQTKFPTIAIFMNKKVKLTSKLPKFSCNELSKFHIFPTVTSYSFPIYT